MPRHESPTAKEMIADFNADAHQLFISAYEREFADGRLPAALEDKPLHTLELHVTRDLRGNERYEDSIGASIVKEALEVHALRPDDFDRCYYDSMLPYSAEALAAFHDTAEEVGALVLTGAFDIVTELPTNGVHADYTATLENAKLRHISTLKERPAKASIALGTAFVDHAVEYVALDDFNSPDSTKRLRAIIFDRELTLHRFTLPIRPDVPLNGHESTAYLRKFRSQMALEAERRSGRLAQLEALGAPEPITDSARQSYDTYATALSRVEAILDAKNL